MHPSDYRFAKRVLNVPVSGIGDMMRYGAKYGDVLSLGQGTPIFPTPQFIYEGVYEKAKTDATVGMYLDAKKEKELITLIGKDFRETYGFTPEEGSVYLTSGGIGGLFSALMAVLDRGDEIIYFDPSYPLHLSQIYLTEAQPVFVSLKEGQDRDVDWELLKKSITPKTKAILLTNPNNPTGTVLTEADVQQLAEIVLANDLILILDEAYGFLTYDRSLFSPVKIEALRERTVLCKSFSKEYAMTGWRIGYVYAPVEIIKKINDIHTYFSISPATISVVAATLALSDPRGQEAMLKFKEEFVRSRETICQRLDRLSKLFSYRKPHGAYYVFPKIIGFDDLLTLDFAKLLVDEAKVITIPGSAMGPAGDRHLRLSFAARSDYINQAFDRIDSFARNHNLLSS